MPDANSFSTLINDFSADIEDQVPEKVAKHWLALTQAEKLALIANSLLNTAQSHPELYTDWIQNASDLLHDQVVPDEESI
jgi:recombinational DNA repair protein (RecF pathway)